MSAELFDLSGRVAIVTGGSRGIGMMAARGLLRAGAAVVISSRDARACAQACADLGGAVSAVPADLSGDEECRRLAAEVGRRHGAVDILVNNAGATWGAPLEEFPAAAWDKVLDLNLKAPFFLTRAFLPLLERASTPRTPARVVNIGSIDGLSVPGMPTYAYSASKAGLHHLTRVLAHELGPRNVTCNAIAPGPFPTKMMNRTLEQHPERYTSTSTVNGPGEPDDIAGAVVYLTSRAGRHVTGIVLTVDGGLTLAR
ncbi:SDR family oxidoreductase [Mycobacterium sp. UM_CSW]|uniref:SDR family oxidoreductase n=1 Tax=Mycobacterium sp. UM_CSW TaxID=1370119 RepID=UPI0003FF285F|nr:SDR family oxidoreductase [Mycobacterium sp. UM_CSW]